MHNSSFAEKHWYFTSECMLGLTIHDLPLEAKRSVLTVRRDSMLKPACIECHKCVGFDAALTNALLSPRAFGKIGDEWRVWISKDALTELTQIGKKAIQKVPRFAIADGFAIGHLDIFDDATSVEKQMVALAQIRGLIDVVYGGPGNKLASHLLCWDNRKGHFMSQIPNIITKQTFEVILASSLTNAQLLTMKKRHTCRLDVVHKLERALRQNNSLYDNIAENPTVYSNDMDESIMTVVEEDPEAIEHARSVVENLSQHESVPELQEADEVTVCATETVLLRTVVLNELERCEAGVRNSLSSLATGVNEPADIYVASRSTKILNRRDPKYVEYLFPHLFPFGIGGLSEPRRNKYSKRDVVCHLLRLSSQYFAKDQLFKLVMYDHLATERVMSSIFVRATIQPGSAANAADISPDELRAALRNKKKRKEALSSGKQYVSPTSGSNGEKLLNTIQGCSAKMWGSNDERDGFTRKVTAMCIDRGSPSLFWTFTPKADGSAAFAYWTLEDLPGDRPLSIDDLTGRNMPSSTRAFAIAVGNCVAQADYYWYCVRVLMTHIFGWDIDEKKCLQGGGVFGFIEALFFIAESQGRLTIHHHGCAWIAGMPRTTGDWEKLAMDSTMKKNYLAYSNSIFSSEFPIFDGMDVITCVEPGCSGELQAMPIPVQYRHILKKGVAAPVIAKCGLCHATVKNEELLVCILAIDMKWKVT